MSTESTRNLASVVLILCFATAGSAQTIRGRVVEQGSGVPLVGVFVTAVDTTGARRGAALSDSVGRYFLRTATAGRVLLRAELIGHQTYKSALVSIDSSSVMNIALPVQAITMEGIEAKATQRCTVHPESGEQTARLWDEARKALNVTAWAEKENPVQLSATTYKRMLDAHTLAVRSEVTENNLRFGRAYAAIDVKDLTRYGFARKIAGDSLALFGPDADVLLSDTFLDTHCFRAVQGKGDARGLVGLSFQPVHGRRTTDITGTLWLTASSGELKYVEFKYVGIASAASADEAGGRTDFRRLPNGVWIVERWYIRAPLLALRLGGGLLLTGYDETGGEVVDVNESARQPLPRNRISGLVYDSTRGSPVRQAVVYLSGTGHRTHADLNGRYTLADIPEGSYVVSFWDATIDSLPAFPRSRQVLLASGDSVVLDLAVGSPAALVRQACPAKPRDGVASGYVLAADGPVPFALVQATFATRTGTAKVQAETDKTGRYILCGLPLGLDLRFTAAHAAPEVRSIDERRFVRVDLKISP